MPYQTKQIFMDLSVEYMGLKLKNPLIVGSSGLTSSVEKIRALEAHGAAAVVLKSLFEEQLLMEEEKSYAASGSNDYPEAMDYMKAYTSDYSFKHFIQLIKDSKAAVNIPVIASINCMSMGKWTDYTKAIADAGADALELNISLLPKDKEINSQKNEKLYFDIIEAVRKTTDLPLAIKMSHYSAGLAHLISQLSYTKMVDAFVLFNRYYTPDIDIDTETVTPSNILSRPEDIADTLRWVAIMSGKMQTPIAASTGVHDAGGLIKMLLAGATAVQMVSALYKKGPKYIAEVLEELSIWMEENGYEDLDFFRGKLNHETYADSHLYERVQFMKYFGGFE